MTFSPTESSRAIHWALLGAALIAVVTLASCGSGRSQLAREEGRKAVAGGFRKTPPQFELKGNRYWTAVQEAGRLEVQNSELGTGVSPIWFTSSVPGRFEVQVLASLNKEGLDGGWGLEFGAKSRRFAYRVLLYGSGRFCIDRLFGDYPEFIHCVPVEPSVTTGASRNKLMVRVEGDRISVEVNDRNVVVFRDDRYEPGDLSLAVAGAGTRVRFEDFALYDLGSPTH